MARVSLEGFSDVDAMFAKLGDVPWDVTRQALDQMAEAGEDAVRRTGRSMGVRDPESGVHILDKVPHTKPKQTDGGGYCEVTFSGSRRRGNTTTRNSEIAFINEYGKEGQPARPFIRQAGEQYGDQISEPGEKVVGDWMVDTFNEA
ncbi:MAG: hypothetical protein UHI81_02170 [Olegusella sp.]|nr:hypothetical protein [Olegusella sp.]